MQENKFFEYIELYNKVRLHNSLFYLTPEDYLFGRVETRLADRESKLKAALDNRLKTVRAA